VNKRKSAISSCSSLERGKGFSFPFKVPRYARSLPAPIDTSNHCSKEPLASAIRGPYNQHKTTSLEPDAMLLRNAYETAAPYHPATSYRINNARRDPLVRSNRIWNLRSRPDNRCGISSDGLDPIIISQFSIN